MNGYELTRNWFNFSFENHEAKVQHTALFCWIVELNNRLGWKKEFGLPTIDTMEGLSIGNKNTFLSALSDLEKWGFIKIIKPSKNQYQACIISICCSESATAQGTALDTALQQQSNGIGYGIGDSSVPIDKQINIQTIKQINKETIMGLVSVEENVPVFRKLQEDILNCLPIDESEVAEVVSYLNQKRNSNFKPETKETKRLIGARLKTHTIEDCKNVIDVKTAQWLNDEKTINWLTPSTLFAESNFEKYLVQVADFKEEEAKRIKEEEAKKNRPKPMTIEEMRGW
jgi:uncharacterized phage protein (TIGR02220 family)